MADSNEKLFSEIAEILETNGSVGQRTKDRLILAGIRAIYDLQKSNRDRIVNIEKYVPFLDAAKWVFVALGGSVIALIWALITGRASIVFVP